MIKYLALILLLLALPVYATQESIKFGPVTDAGQNVPLSGIIPNSSTLTECVMLMAGAATLPASNAPARSIVAGTNFSYPVLSFDDATDESAFWLFDLPSNIVGTTAVVTTSWTASACTATTADQACWTFDGDSFKDDGTFKTSSLSGTEVSGQSNCAAADDYEFGPDIVYTHGWDVAQGANGKDTFAVMKINRDADMGNCSGTFEVSGDVDLLSVRVCYETENIASGENAVGSSSLWDTMEWAEDNWG